MAKIEIDEVMEEAKKDPEPDKPLSEEVDLTEYIPDNFDASKVFQVQKEAEVGSFGHFINNLADITHTQASSPKHTPVPKKTSLADFTNSIMAEFMAAPPK